MPFFVATIGLSLFSMRASMVLTLLGLLGFAIAYSRPVGRSLKGLQCAFCPRKIIFEHEGDYCPTCDQPIHGKCMDEHRMSAHAPKKDQPFR